jgi:hypothetical protein
VVKRHKARPAKGTPAKGEDAGLPVVSAIVVGVMGAVTFALVFGWCRVAPILLAPLVTGALVGLALRRPLMSGITAAVAGIVGAGLSATVYTTAAYEAAVTGMPAYANPDVPRVLYQIAWAIIASNPLNAPGAGPAGVIAAGLVLTTAVAYGIAWAIDRMRAEQETARSVVAWVIVVVLCASFLVTVLDTSKDLMAYADTEPVVGQYSFDAIIYLRTYYRMLDGQDFYPALVTAAAGDARLMKENAIRDGKFYAWALSAFFVRQPYLFRLWTAVAPKGGGIVTFGALLCVAVLALSYWGAVPFVGGRALFVPAFLMPLLLFMTLGFNVFFADYWAALCALASVVVLLRKQWVASAVLALLAAACREALLPWLLILAACAVWFWWRSGRTREWAVRAAACSGLSILFAAAYAFHVRTAAAYIGTSLASPVDHFLGRVSADLTFKVLSPTSYMMFPYGHFSVPGVVLWLAAPLGFWLALRSETQVRAAVLLFSGFWIGWYFVFGPSSSYWGQHVLPVAVVGFALLLASIDQGCSRIAWPRERR